MYLGREAHQYICKEGQKKSKKEKDIEDLRNFKKKIEGQVLGDVLVPKNLDKNQEFVLDNDIYAGKKVVEGDVVDEMVVVDCNLDANKELTCNIKEVKKSEVLDTTDFRA